MRSHLAIEVHARRMSIVVESSIACLASGSVDNYVLMDSLIQPFLKHATSRMQRSYDLSHRFVCTTSFRGRAMTSQCERSTLRLPRTMEGCGARYLSRPYSLVSVTSKTIRNTSLNSVILNHDTLETALSQRLTSPTSRWGRTRWLGTLDSFRK